jgi:hypothetical protein
MFMERTLELLDDSGYGGLVTMQSWMFLASYETLRKNLFKQGTIECLAHLDNMVLGIAFGTAACVMNKSFRKESNGSYCYVELNDLDESGVPSRFPPRNERLSRASIQDFESFPGNAMAYWASSEEQKAFATFPQLREYAAPVQGMATTNNELFLRHWHEVGLIKTKFDAESEDDAEASGKKWFPYNKGGEYRKWFGNCEYVVNFENRGQAICEYIDNTPGAKVGSNGRVINRDKYFKRGITWTSTSSSYFGVRHSDPGFVFDVKGSSCFAPETFHYAILGFLASSLTTRMLEMLNPTIEFQNGNLKTLPMSQDLLTTPVLQELDNAVRECVAISRDDWNCSEFSWAFQKPQLLVNKTSFLKQRWETIKDSWRASVDRMQQLESVNNRKINGLYSVETDGEVPLAYITLSCNPVQRYGSEKSESELEALLQADTMREFVSYAVGCMLGRYSLDKPGLILANQGDTLAEYLAQVPEPSFMPDDDNVIPMLDGDWFTDDISERFREFLKVTFGTEHYAENLKFLEDAIYPDNATARKRKTIRDYFAKDFYNHHVKLYKKRPIYWLFSSPKGTFNALIYLHRYRPDTVSTVLQYLRDFRDKLAHAADHAQMVADSGGSTKSEQTKALKEVTAIKKQLKELEEYERDTLFPLAQKKIEIDLDNGVKHNYPLFGKALKKVTGLS